ncbi:MAG: hypothetical protein V1837_03770 [Candidatus Woesearchaeota archaeon]
MAKAFRFCRDCKKAEPISPFDNWPEYNVAKGKTIEEMTQGAVPQDDHQRFLDRHQGHTLAILEAFGEATTTKVTEQGVRDYYLQVSDGSEMFYVRCSKEKPDEPLKSNFLGKGTLVEKVDELVIKTLSINYQKLSISMKSGPILLDQMMLALRLVKDYLNTHPEVVLQRMKSEEATNIYHITFGPNDLSRFVNEQISSIPGIEASLGPGPYKAPKALESVTLMATKKVDFLQQT